MPLFFSIFFFLVEIMRGFVFQLIDTVYEWNISVCNRFSDDRICRAVLFGLRARARKNA